VSSLKEAWTFKLADTAGASAAGAGRLDEGLRAERRDRQDDLVR
jgi:hypothetical protein